MRVDSLALHHLFRGGPIRHIFRRVLPPAPPPFRGVRPRPIRLLLRVPRNVAIRVGPDLLAHRRERILASALLDESRRDTFTWTSHPLDVCNPGAERSCSSAPPACRQLELLLEQTQRDLDVAQAQLARARRSQSDTACGSGAWWREPVGYAYQWQPPAANQSAGVQVVHVPGVVRSHVEPTGRLIDVLM